MQGARSFFSTTELSYPEPEELAGVLARQLMSPVKFMQSMEALLGAADAPVEGLEMGPGAILTGLMKRIARDFPMASTGDAESLRKALEAVEQTGGAL